MFAIFLAVIIGTGISQLIPGVGEQCQEDFGTMLQGYKDITGQTTAGQMIRYSGISINQLGDFDNCNDIDDAEYAWTTIAPGAGLAICGPQSCNETDYNNILLYLLPTNFTDYTVQHNTFKNQREQLLRSIYKGRMLNLGESLSEELTFNVIFPQHYINDNFTDFEAGRVVMTVFCGILAALATAATIIDIWHAYFYDKQLYNQSINLSDMKLNYTKEEQLIENSSQQVNQPQKQQHVLVTMLMCFSVYSNVKKLFASRSAERTGQRSTLEILNCVRVCSMGWVILGHVYVIRLMTVVQNFQDIGDVYGYKRTALIYGGFYSVDTFFWLSGFLAAYLFIGQYVAKGKMSFVLVYVHRFLRILPVYMFTLCFIWAYLKYVGYGPMWFNGDGLNNECKRHWWTNMLFLNNFIPDGDGNGCMGWSWYLANDMQFFLFTPIVLFLYHKISKALGWGILFAFLILHILSNIFIARHYDFYVAGPNTTNHSNEFDDIYIKPYCRCGVYVIGVACGLIMHANDYWIRERSHYDKLAGFCARMIHNSFVRWGMYLLGAALVNIFIFVQRSAYKDQGDIGHDMWSHAERYLWYGFSRIGFIFGLSLILMPMLLGHGPLARNAMASAAWTPLARLSFSCYLIHFAVMWSFFQSQRHAYYLNDMYLFIDTILCTVCSYACALIPCLLVESPAMGLEKILIPMLMKLIGGRR